MVAIPDTEILFTSRLSYPQALYIHFLNKDMRYVNYFDNVYEVSAAGADYC